MVPQEISLQSRAMLKYRNFSKEECIWNVRIQGLGMDCAGCREWSPSSASKCSLIFTPV